MRLLKKYRVAYKSPSKRTVADLGKNAGRAELKRLVDNAVNLKRIVNAAGNSSLSRFVGDLPLKCGELDVMDIRVVESKAKTIASILDVLDKTARNGDVFEDAVTAQLERNYSTAFNAVKSSLADYLKARRTSVKGDAVRAAKCKRALEAVAGLPSLINECYSEIADLANSSSKEEQAFGETMFLTILNGLKQANTAALGLKKQYEAFKK